ncbi:MAG: hypothetical protein ACK4R6_00550 [Spirosomataceae bacterium]
MRKITLYFSFILLFASLAGFGQSFRRIELPIQGNPTSYNLMPLKEKGFILANMTEQRVLQISKYDSLLTQVWQLETEIEPGFNYIDQYADDTHVFLLFGNRSGDQFTLVRVAGFLGAIQKTRLTSLRNFELNQFRVIQNTIYLAGVVKNEPVLISYAFGQAAPKILNSGLGKNANLQSIETLDDNLLLTYSIREKKCATLVLREITADGKVVRQTVIKPKDNFSLFTGKIFPTGANSFLIGSYGYGGTNGIQSLEYLPFGEFENFFNYLPNRQKDRVERNVEKQKGRGNTYTVTSRVFVHDVLETEKGFSLVAEIFTPEYVSNFNNFGMMSPFSPFWGSPFAMSPFYRNYWGFNSWAWNPWLMGSPNNAQTFNGFRYTHGIVVGFDQNGKRQYDHSVVYTNLRLFELQEKLTVTVRDGKKLAAYTKDNELIINEFGETEGENKQRTFEIVTGKEKERIKETTFENTAHWFDNYFLAWGVQKITSSTERNRQVFYIHRIKY